MASITETHIENRERIQPNDTNNYGAAHGGNIMRWMDEVGALSAMRHAGETCVTAHVNDLDFKRPIPQGDTCVITAYAYAIEFVGVLTGLPYGPFEYTIDLVSTGADEYSRGRNAIVSAITGDTGSAPVGAGDGNLDRFMR